MKLSDYEQNSIDKLGHSLHNGLWSNEGLVQLIELVGIYLNLQTISDYAKSHQMSYNGVKKHRKVVEVFKTKYVIDNE